jgi:hypothetical protein
VETCCYVLPSSCWGCNYFKVSSSLQNRQASCSLPRRRPVGVGTVRPCVLRRDLHSFRCSGRRDELTDRRHLPVTSYYRYCRSRQNFASKHYSEIMARNLYIPQSYRGQIFWEVVGLERGPLSLVSTTEELLGKKSSDSCLDSREYGRRDPSRWPRAILHPQKLAVTSPTSGGRSVGIVRSQTHATKFVFV